MRLLGNIIWFVFGGLIGAAAWFIAGVLVSLTVVGIPFGMQCFKISGYVLWPFGKEIQLGDFGAMGLLGNVLWIILLGWELALQHAFFAAVLAVTIIGIPFAMQQLKLIQLSFIPFGARVVYR